jgi:O-antigen/teichoic acid export membrane protein
MSNTRKVAYNTIVQIISRVLTTAISLVALGYLTRYLDVAGYGQYDLVFAYLALFGVVVDFGFFLLQVREITKTPEREGYILGNVLGLKLVLSVVVFGIGYVVANFVYHDPLIIMGILVGSLSQAAIAWTQVPISLFQAKLQMDKVAILTVLSRAAYLGGVIWGVHAGWNIVGLVVSVTVINLVVFFVQMLLARPLVKIAPQWDFKYWWIFVREAFPLGVAIVLATIYFSIDRVMLSVMKTTYEVGLYGTPYRVIGVILTFPTIFMSSVFPIMTRALGESREQALSVFRKAFDFSALAAFPVAFGVMMVATPLMVVIAGAKFAPSGPALQWLVWATMLSFFGAVFNYTMIAAGHQRSLTIPYLAATVFNVVANLIFIPTYSYMGASVVTVATELLVVTWVGVITFRTLNLAPAWSVTGKAALAGTIMAGVIWLVGSTNLLLNVGIGAVVYGGLILLLRAVSPDIIKELRRAS